MTYEYPIRKQAAIKGSETEEFQEYGTKKADVLWKMFLQLVLFT